MKARQEEENKQQVENAADSAAAASKGQEEIDQKNADLYMMLKSFEEDDGGEGTGEGRLALHRRRSLAMPNSSTKRRRCLAYRLQGVSYRQPR